MNAPRLIVPFFLAAILTIVLCAHTSSFAINIGDPFPPFSKSNILSHDECVYLGIDSAREFTLNDLRHEVIIIEFLNVYCHTCRKQVEIFNDLYTSIQNDPELAGKVCIVGIAVGNSPEEIIDFKKNFGALYPILSDPGKALFNMTGNIQGTPHTYILRKEEKRFVIDYHAGGVTSKDRYLSTITFALRGTLTGTNPGNKAPGFAFKSRNNFFNEKSFTGKRLIFYFPVNKIYPLSMDTRNRGNQIKILHDIVKTFPDITVVVFKSQGVSLPSALTTASFFVADEEIKNSLDAFRAANEPVIFYINEYGRISFKGEAITLYNAQSIMQGKQYKPVLDIKDDELIRMINESITKSDRKVVTTEKEVQDDGTILYITTLAPKRDGLFLFSRLESRPSLCDICHDSHFIYILDQDGFFVDFIPVQLTKLGNVPWSMEDVQMLKGKIAGKNIFENFPFNPKVDAVTSATMSSSLVYEAFNDGKEVFKNFKAYKFRYEYWRDVCFKNICVMKRKIGEMKQTNKDQTVDDSMLQKVLKEKEITPCPLDGMYMLLDGNILCSIHGLHTRECKD
ncbi:MAG: redoxin domain-containing protein [Pseudomonadota bacterium]